MKHRSLIKLLQISLPLALGLFLIWYIYDSFTPEQLDETRNHFANAHYGFVILAVILNVLSHLTRAYRWKYLLLPLGYRPQLSNNFMALSVGYLLNAFIPRSGEVSRAALLDRYEQVPFQKGFGTIISERIVDLIFLAFFTTLALFFEFDVLYDYIIQNIPFQKLLIFITIGTLIVLGIFAYLLLSKTESRLKTFLSGLKDGVLSILRMKQKTAFILYSFLIWVLYVLGFYAAIFALPETATLSFGTVIIGFVVGGFVISFTNSGFGSYPFALAGILSVFGIAKTVGIAFGWIVWISNMVTTVLFGVLSLVLLPVYNNRRKSKTFK